LNTDHNTRPSFDLTLNLIHVIFYWRRQTKFIYKSANEHNDKGNYLLGLLKKNAGLNTNVSFPFSTDQLQMQNKTIDSTEVINRKRVELEKSLCIEIN